MRKLARTESLAKDPSQMGLETAFDSARSFPISAVFSDGFGQFLAAASLIDDTVLDRAKRAAMSTGERLDRVLIKLGLLPEYELTQALGRYLKLPVATATDIPSGPILTDIIDVSFIRHNHIIPLKADSEVLEVAVIDPLDEEPRRALSYLTDLRIVTRLLVPTQFERTFELLYAAHGLDLKSSVHSESIDANDFDIQRLLDLASEAPTIRLVNQIISDAVERHSSDIHIEPTADAVLVRYRIDGILQTAKTLHFASRAAITSRLKIISKLDIAERRLPQDGRTKIAFRGVDIDFRVSTIPTTFGESVVMRILDRSRVELDFEKLGFDQKHISTLEDVIRQPDGIVLVTGPTGSGKTTTLYTALKSLNSSERKILTVEDPVEYQLTGINQVQVQPNIGLTFPAALRSILRQDPDIIMIGEIRDLDTARIAIQASLTGHLVLSTLHTNSAAATITRLIDMGIENYLLTSTLKAIVAQRLVRCLCQRCSTPHTNASFLATELRRSVPKIAQLTDLNIREKRGCKECGGTGFAGRSTIAEILVLDAGLRQMILSRMPDKEIELAAQARGMSSMYENGVMKVLSGETTIDEVIRATRSS